MKKIFKLFTTILAVAISVLSVLTFSACKDVKTAKAEICVYNYETEKFNKVTIEVKLYRHLAEKTVDNVISAINDGYYDNTAFYQLSSTSSTIMVGDLKINEENITVQENRPKVEGEFSANGVTGTNLFNTRGSIGLWRSYVKGAGSGSYKNSDAGKDSGTAIWYLPLSDIADYNDYYAVFATIDLEDEETANVLKSIETVFNKRDYLSYTTFYTEEESGLERHILPTNNMTESNGYNETDKTYNDKKIFEPTANDLVQYGKTEMSVPRFKEGKCLAYISSIKMK